MCKKNIIIFLGVLLLANCQELKSEVNTFDNNKKDRNTVSASESLGTFSENDSVGSVTGLVVAANDTGNGSYSVDITLKDKNGVERKFYADYVNVPGIDFKKIKKDVCVNIEYTSEVHKEEGVIDGRIYSMTKIIYK